MLINLKNQQVDFICFDKIAIKTFNNTTDINNLTRIVKTKKISELTPEYSSDYISHFKFYFSWETLGFYTGTTKDLEQELLLKKYPNSLDTVNRIYFSNNCKYPRYKVAQLSSIKSIRDYKKADTVVISFPKFINDNIYKYGPKPLYTILYSKILNRYYIYNTQLFTSDSNSGLFFITNLINNNTNSKLVHTERIVSALISSLIIPDDCSIIYEGEIRTINTLTNYELLEDLLNTYKNIIFETELDSFLNTKLEKITSEIILNIFEMLKSNDLSTVDLGLKLLSSYDLSPYRGSVTTILLLLKNNIKRSTIIKSTGFLQVLLILDITLSNSSFYDTHFINDSFLELTSDNDRTLVKYLISSNITNYFNSHINNEINKTYPNLNLKFTLTIE